MSLVRVAFVVTVIVASSCAVFEGDVDLSVAEQETNSACPVWGCGSNSPEIDGLGFHDLFENGYANAQGFRIDWFRKYANGVYTYYRPDVYRAQLLARDLAGSGIQLSGSSLAGTEFRLTRDGTTDVYRMRIAQVSRSPYWAKPHGLIRVTHTYRIEWVDESAIAGLAVPWQNVCRDPGGINDDGTMDEFHAVLFDDERIDAVTKRVVGSGRYLFNIGCAGTALAKQHLTGHTGAAGLALGISTSYAQRTANLKMLSGDYCGTGEPFTVAGQPLAWRDQYDWYNSIAAGDVLEARWTEFGATCLNTPRVDAHSTSLGFDTFGASVEDDIAARCTRPAPCMGAVSDMQGSHVLSANP